MKGVRNMVKKLLVNVIAVLSVMSVIFLASACEELLPKKEQYIGTAEAYLKKLEEAAPEEDTLTIDPDNPVDYLGSDFIVFSAWSEKYQDSFSVFVNTKDNSCMDSYYELYLLDEAEERYKRFTEEHAFTEPVRVYLPHIAGSKYSGAKIKSMSEFWDTVSEECLCADYPKLTEEEILPVLKALQEEKLYTKVSIEGMEEVYYALSDGIYIEERSGKDGGKMIERRKIN